MRAFDARWIRLAIAAGAIVGSALVSSVAVAADESPSTEPPPTTPSDVASIDVDPDSADVIVVDTADPMHRSRTSRSSRSWCRRRRRSDPMGSNQRSSSRRSAARRRSTSRPWSPDVVGTVRRRAGRNRPRSRRAGGTRWRTPGWLRRSGQSVPDDLHGDLVQRRRQQITALDVVLPPDVLAQFELSAASQTGKGKPTSATCTYPDGGTVLRCEFHNPGHGSGTDGLIVPARPTATYAVTVDWPVNGWTITGADGDGYSARDLCPRGGDGGGGHEEGGGDEEGGGHEEGGGQRVAATKVARRR